MMADPVPEGLHGYGAASQHIYHLIQEADEPPSRQEILSVVTYDPHTVTRSIDKLRDNGWIEDRPHLQDARQNRYVVDRTDD